MGPPPPFAAAAAPSVWMACPPPSPTSPSSSPSSSTSTHPKPSSSICYISPNHHHHHHPSHPSHPPQHHPHPDSHQRINITHNNHNNSNKINRNYIHTSTSTNRESGGIQDNCCKLVRHFLLAFALLLVTLGGHAPVQLQGGWGQAMAGPDAPPPQSPRPLPTLKTYLSPAQVGNPPPSLQPYKPLPTPQPQKSFLPSHLSVASRRLSTTSSKSPKIIQQHIAAIFEANDFKRYENAFLLSTNTTNAEMRGLSRPVQFTHFAMLAPSNAQHYIQSVCKEVNNSNISAFIAIGNQDNMNMLTVVATYTGIPVIGYNTDRQTLGWKGKTGDYSDDGHIDSQGRKMERPMYLQMDPSRSLIARALVRSLEANNWYYASLIVDEDYATDGFIHTFKFMTSDDRWRIEDTIILSAKSRKQTIDSKLYNLLENKSRVIILHASVVLARKVFNVASENGFTSEGYAWFLTEYAVTKDEEALQDYPAGLVAFYLDYQMNLEDIVYDSMQIIRKGTARYASEHPKSLEKLPYGKGCYAHPTAEQYRIGEEFYRYLKNTSLVGVTGNLSFNKQGVRAEANFTVLNLIEKTKGKRWKVIGRYRNDTFKVSTIVWPGKTLAGPIVMGERTLRVVTNIIAPFVMEQEAIANKCLTAVPCLRVENATKNKEMLDGIFKDFANDVRNESRPYEVRCCQGLSIHLLDRLARDLNFSYHLYITSDNKYGDYEDGAWNGLVEDLQVGAAHMAVAAFSITKSRSSVIDFTQPYFFSGFSILVSERKRQTPIYAFMEPFDGWVWISIVISATVMAVAVSLVEWNSPFGLNPWGRKRKTNYTFGSALNMVYAIFFQHTTKTKSPKAWPSKWIQNFWAGVSIFIYSSYTANLAAFLAGKNSGVTISGIHDPKLLEPGRQVGIIKGNSVQDFLSEVNSQLLYKAQRYSANLPIETALALLMNGTIDAYLDDMPVLEYARSTMDAKCLLRLVGKGFGEEGYGIGLPKGSFLKVQLSQKILEYHESGFIEDLQDLYFRRSQCNDNVEDRQLQGEAAPMNFEQHAGLYLLLAVGIFVCIGLMFLEHATFRWLVPYWRKKPLKSFWKSYSMMFWSQRLYRIITSEELVSPHHSAREMIEVVKNRDFTKLFQKSVKKQERQARNRKNFFTVVEQLQWKQRREERLSQNPSLQTDCSQESDNSATPVNLNIDRRHCTPEDPITTDTNDDPGDDWPENWEKEWVADDEDDEDEDEDDEETGCIGGKRDAGHRTAATTTLYKDGHVNHSFSSQADILKLDPGPTPSSAPPLECCVVDSQGGAGGLTMDASHSPQDGATGLNNNCPQFSFCPEDEYVFSFTTDPRDSSYTFSPKHRKNRDYCFTPPTDRKSSGPTSAPPVLDLLGSSLDDLPGAADMEDDPLGDKSLSYNPGMPLLGNNSSSEDNILMSQYLPNGVLILSPNGDVFARDNTTGRNVLVRPKTFANFKNFTTNLPQSMKTLPLKDNRVKSNLLSRSRTLDGLNDGAINNDIEPAAATSSSEGTSMANLEHLSKEQLYFMWKTSEKELHKRLKRALKDKAELEQKLAKLQPPAEDT